MPNDIKTAQDAIQLALETKEYVLRNTNKDRDTINRELKELEKSLNKQLQLAKKEGELLEERLKKAKKTAQEELRQSNEQFIENQRKVSALNKQIEDIKKTFQENKKLTSYQKQVLQAQITENQNELQERKKQNEKLKDVMNSLPKSLDDVFDEVDELLKQAKKFKEEGQEEQAKEIEARAQALAGPIPIEWIKKFSEIKTPLQKIADVSQKIFGTLNKGVTQAMTQQSDIMGQVNSRLSRMYDDQRNQTNAFQDLSKEINSAFGANAFINQKKVVDNIAQLTNQGVSYNLTERAVLMELQEKLVSTFNVLEPAILRLTKLQQTDIASTMMGAESNLTRFLNSQFNDTSYLTQMYDSVYNAIVDASSLMDTSQATGFNNIIQAWLGSLYAVGMSDTAVQNIASAMGQLASGNLSQLTNNVPMQTLIASSLQRSGYSYADIMTQGMNLEQTNSIMKSMVEYLKSISENTSSNVLRSEFKNIFGIEQSDWRALSNLSSTDIGDIYTNASYMTYQQSQQEISNLLTASTLSNRISTQSQISNIIDNVLYNFGNNLASDPGNYIGWQVGQLIAGINTGSNLGNLITRLGGSAVQLFSGFDAAYKTFTSLADVIDRKGLQLEGLSDFLIPFVSTTMRGPQIPLQGSRLSPYETYKYRNKDYESYLESTGVTPYDQPIDMERDYAAMYSDFGSSPRAVATHKTVEARVLNESEARTSVVNNEQEDEARRLDIQRNEIAQKTLEQNQTNAEETKEILRQMMEEQKTLNTNFTLYMAARESNDMLAYLQNN